ncbi:hypothetical protein Lal_00006854 [Lupinus albus]|uniref:ferric-chelate reductase (NADH) n=1 Tax=Lupinus albus TaxID=3870 RepID=A0A6A5MX28_LUPAL|nr:putative ferric-chelate reductase (NADH) [Lupinus albus]KAF1876223.1 hypothetical protein Lal_00006854 [Lupinus albus]
MVVEVVKKSLSSKEKYGMIQSAIWLFVLVVFLAWIFIWIMTPTNTWKQVWMPQLLENTASTYFGVQGLPLLLYTFPVLFIAVLGCVYLHIAKNTNSSNMERCNDGKKCIWKRPVLVRGLLGIVSGTELAFLFMFIALLVWSFSTYLHNDFATITHKSAAKLGLKVWERRLDKIAIRFGLVGNICFAFLFFPVARASSLLPLLGLTSERCIKYHIWLGHITMTLFTLHGLCFIIFWVVTGQTSKMLEWKKIGISKVAGELSLLCGLFTWVATIPRVRRKMFELFFYTHHLYIFFIVFFIFHVGIYSTFIMLPGLYLFLVDRFLRFLQSKQRVSLVSARVLPCETVELNFSKDHGMTYNPTSIMFINVPSISKLQWHPFTITSHSNFEKEKLSIVIKSEGTWSKKLYHMLSTPSSINHLNVSVEGPHGPTSTNYIRYDTLVMVSGGSGITPFVSIIKELIYMSTTFRYSTPKTILICAFKNTSCLSLLDLILPNSCTPYDISSTQIQIEAYITRDTKPKPDNLIQIQSIWFKPNADDAPISAMLGSHCWLWLAAIITSSSIISFIIIGLITHYFIFPIDHNTNEIFSSSLMSFIKMLVICVSIVIAGSAAFLWNKKQNAKKAKKIQNMEGSSPSAVAPDRELESLPQQSLAQATNVHYGARPDLKRLLCEIKGSSVGVLVAGPMKMKEEVAAICSSDLAENLHFESFSFGW